METIGQRIHTARKKQGITQGEIAQRLGVSINIVSKWENGKSTPRQDKHINGLVSILGLSKVFLLFGEEYFESAGLTMDDKLAQLSTHNKDLVHKFVDLLIEHQNTAKQKMTGNLVVARCLDYFLTKNPKPSITLKASRDITGVSEMTVAYVGFSRNDQESHIKHMTKNADQNAFVFESFIPGFFERQYNWAVVQHDGVTGVNGTVLVVTAPGRICAFDLTQKTDVTQRTVINYARVKGHLVDRRLGELDYDRIQEPLAVEDDSKGQQHIWNVKTALRASNTTASVTDGSSNLINFPSPQSS